MAADPTVDLDVHVADADGQRSALFGGGGGGGKKKKKDGDKKGKGAADGSDGTDSASASPAHPPQATPSATVTTGGGAGGGGGGATDGTPATKVDGTAGGGAQGPKAPTTTASPTPSPVPVPVPPTPAAKPTQLAVPGGGTVSLSSEDRLRAALLSSSAAVSSLDVSAPVNLASLSLGESIGNMVDYVDDTQKFDENDIQAFLQNKFVQNAISKGMDLREYAKEISTSLRTVERNSILDYMKEANNLSALHAQIGECDAILEKMETLLSGFQTDLGKVSEDVKTLQEDSLKMQRELRNKKTLGQLLKRFVNNVVVPQELVENIFNGKVDVKWMDNLKDLDMKINFYKSDEVAGAANDAKNSALLESLRVKAVTRIREFMMGKVYALRQPQTNIQTRQQSMLKYKYMMEFVAAHDREVYKEIRSEYADSLGNIFLTYVRARIGTLSKLEADAPEKGDVIGALDSNSKGIFGIGGSKPRNRTIAFSLGGREEILKNLDNTDNDIIVHVAAQNKTKFPYEAIFRSLETLIMDCATSEYIFLLNFFGKTGSLFTSIFEKSFALFTTHLAEHVSKSYDFLGLLLCLRINTHHQIVMNRRRVPALDSLLDAVNMAIWPRVKHLLDGHIESLSTLLHNRRSLTAPDGHAHTVTVRYSELMSAVFAVLGTEVAPMSMSLQRLARTVGDLLAVLADLLRGGKARQVFMINNYSHIVGSLAARSPAHANDDAGTRVFEDIIGPHMKIRDDNINTYVQELLLSKFGLMAECVSRGDAALVGMDGPSKEKAGADGALGNVQAVVRDFAGTWYQRLTEFETEVVQTFDAPSSRAIILKTLIGNLSELYVKFLELCHDCFRHPTWENDIVDKHKVMVECRNLLARYRVDGENE